MPADEGRDLEAIWGELLSRDPGRIRRAAGGLTADEREVVTAHLRRMATDEGWMEVQRISARAALEALDRGNGE